MIYKLVNNDTTKILKTDFGNFFNILLNDFNKVIAKFIIRDLKVSSKKTKFIIQNNLLFYTISNFSFVGCKKMLDHDQKIMLFLPLIFKQTKNVNFFIHYIIGELPRISFNRDFYLNGLQKIFINKTILDKRGVYYNSYIKKDNLLIYCKYILDENNVFYIINNKNTYQFVFDNNIIDVISLFTFLGISFSNIYKYFDVSNFKTILYCCELDKSNVFKRENLLKLIKIIHLTFSLEKRKCLSISNKECLTLFCLEIITICNFLSNIKQNKNSLSDLDLLSSKRIININNYLLYCFKLHIKRNASKIKEDIKFVINSLKFEEKNTLLKVKAKNYFEAKENLTVTSHIQCLDKINSLSKISHRNKISNYNSSSLHSLTVRNVKLNNLGFISPVETTEGINCGLVLGFTKNTRVTKYKTLEASLLFNKDNKSDKYFTFLEESTMERTFIVFNNYVLRKNKYLSQEDANLIKNSFKISNLKEKAYFYLPYKNILSYSENLIPFLFCNDPTRILMGAKMQSQSLPILNKTRYLIVTGEEQNIIHNTPEIIRSNQEGIVTFVSNSKIIIQDIYMRKHIYYLTKYRHNDYSIVNQIPIVWPGEKVLSGQLLVSIQDSIDSDFVTGNNVIVSYGNFFGYNFEDSIVLSKKVIYTHMFSSINSDVYELTFNTPYKYNSIEIPGININNNLYHRKNTDKYGIIKEGTKVQENDILISKFILSEIFLKKSDYIFILSLFGHYIRIIKELSISVPNGGDGRIIKTEIFSSNNYYFYLKIRIYVVKHRLLKIGDKLCGFYGNKGIISYISSNKDLLYSINGIYPDLITDAIGIPSRMNLGQLFENLFGLSCTYHGVRLSFINRDPYLTKNLKRNIYVSLKNLAHLFGLKKIYNCYNPGKLSLRNGLTGYIIKEPSFLGIARYFKLLHMSEDKLHYRTTGPYTEILQQPVKGKSNIGGQRFGEMEIWALQAYGNSYTIREILSYKSDDIEARNSIKSYYNNQYLGKVTVSEGFNIFINEINSMFLNIETFISSKHIINKKTSVNKITLD